MVLRWLAAFTAYLVVGGVAALVLAAAVIVTFAWSTHRTWQRR